MKRERVKAKRIQLSRTRGWRMPPNTVKVDRRSPWGNIYKVVREDSVEGLSRYWGIEDITGDSEIRTAYSERSHAVEASLALFRDYAKSLDVSDLRGRNLACWCKPGEPCHADVLLEIANAKARTPSPKARRK